ncbi:hypothetical protein DPMN_150818 [Dreissena polymorpha]|uniref:Uncharacterized protein n=1 Tax=Dreissena polymorpha TaxID=45954 RepID=A0A9D4J2E1_DREPO|nr:hypothetical protein DPMN_150818 [Dreissena polymorpha]
MSLRGKCRGLNVDAIQSLSQSLLSLTHLETLSIEVDDDSPAFWEALLGLNIKSLSLSGQFGGLNVNHADSMSRSLASLNQLETLSISVRKYNDIQLPQPLKYLYIYCSTLLPSELRELVDTLSTFNQTAESKLEFGCASCEDFCFQPIPPEEYIAIQQELETLKNVAVERIRILNRSSKTGMFDNAAASARSVRGVSCVENDNRDSDNFKDDEYERYFDVLSNEIINRISMRLRITPVSNS